jgi:hypothetical protein
MHFKHLGWFAQGIHCSKPLFGLDMAASSLQVLQSKVKSLQELQCKLMSLGSLFWHASHFLVLMYHLFSPSHTSLQYFLAPTVGNYISVKVNVFPLTGVVQAVHWVSLQAEQLISSYFEAQVTHFPLSSKYPVLHVLQVNVERSFKITEVTSSLALQVSHPSIFLAQSIRQVKLLSETL